MLRFADEHLLRRAVTVHVRLPHSIQALDQGVEFLLVFDDGGFSENETFLITDSHNFTVSEPIAAALVEIEPGGMREMHWHPNSDE
jgi:oxalate decarboxylase